MSSEKPTSRFVPGKLLFVWVGYVVCLYTRERWPAWIWQF